MTTLLRDIYNKNNQTNTNHYISSISATIFTNQIIINLILFIRAKAMSGAPRIKETS